MMMSCFAPASAQVQKKMKIALTDGRTLLLPLDSISGIAVQPVAAEGISQLAGSWQFIASANGAAGEGGIHTATADTIAFTATVGPDGMGLVCEAPRFYTRTGNVYPARWRMVLEENAATGKHRVGWVLTASEPASDREFNEPAEKYLEDGFFYWGDGSEPHHYIYLLSENIDTQRLEAMTLWSGWADKGQTTYTFPQNQEIYGVVGTAIPYAPGTSVGYFEIWASARFVRVQQ